MTSPIRALVLTLVIAVAAIGTSAAPQAHEEFGFVGTLVAVNATKTRISVKYTENGKDDVVRIALTQKTVVTRDKRPVLRSVLKVGLSVVVRALGDDDTNLEAITIRIVPALPKK